MQLLYDFYKKLTRLQIALIIILAILLCGLYFFGLNPVKKMADMRNSQRRKDITSILNAVYQFSNKGEISTISMEPKMICRDTANSCEGMVDLGNIILKEKNLLTNIPVDPREKNPDSSGYKIWRMPNGRIAVSAPLAENNAVITLSK